MESLGNNTSSELNVTAGFNNYTVLSKFNSDFNVRVLPVSIVFGLTACLGFFANILVVYVYGLKYKQCNFKYFLFVLGLIGLVQCTIMLPTQVAEMHYWFMFPTSWLCRVSAYIFGYTVINCYFILLLIALDRFRKVCRPYDWQIQPGTAKNLCITVSIASLVFAAPPGIISGHHRFVTSYNDVNITVTVCATDDMYLDRDWAGYFLLLFGGLPVSIVILVTCILYGLILRQFYLGPAVAMRSLYGTSSTAITSDKRVDGKQNVLTSSLQNINETPTKIPQKSPKPTPRLTRKKSHRASQLKKLFQSIIPGQNSIKSTTSSESGGPQTSDNLRSSRNNVAKSGVRKKLMRKTLIVLIITVSCIVALIITFCLHIIAENINQNALTISLVKLNAFVIFHRGSFSIICAIFPIIYGMRDPKFRKAFLAIVEIFHCKKSDSLTIQTENKCVSTC